MKTTYEKDDVSKFRKFVREKRFSQPKYEDNLNQFLKRLNGNDAFPISVVTAKGLKGDNVAIDSVGIGKTDFTYFAANYFRQSNPKIDVLTFPNVFDQITQGGSFYNAIFVPEIIKITRTKWDQLKNYLGNIKIILKSFFNKFFLLLRVNVLLTVALLAFLIGAISLDDIFTHQSEITSIISEIATPIALGVVVVIWLLIIWDKISKDDKYSLEWNKWNYSQLKQVNNVEMMFVAPNQLSERFNANDKVIIIIDDVNRMDPESLNMLIKLVSPDAKTINHQSRKFGLILVTEAFRDGTNTTEQIGVHQILSEYRCRVNHWQCFDLFSPSLDEIEWLLWGAYDSGHPWEAVKKLIEKYPAIQNNTGFLLQFLYDETTALDDPRVSLANIDFQTLLEDYKSFLDYFELHAERILARIPDEISKSGRELLKYMLAFDSPLPNIDKLHSLMELNSLSNTKQVSEVLIQKNVIKPIDGSYIFCNSAERNTLLLNWKEWINESSSYYTKVFNYLHDASTLADNPRMAIFCNSSDLVVDVLWREGDSLWFYGGYSDIQTALTYYGIENGALGKWKQLFLQDLSAKNLSLKNFYWDVRAKNSQFRYKTGSRSERSASFIGDLIQVTASIYFVAGEYEKSLQVLGELWEQIKDAYWGLNESSNRINERMQESDLKIKLQYSEYLSLGLAKKENMDLAQKTLNSIDIGKIPNDATAQVRTLLWRMSYFAKYGVGNLLSSLWLIRDFQIDDINLGDDKKFLQASLSSTPIRLLHYSDYINWGLYHYERRFNISEPLEYMRSLLEGFEKDIQLFERRVDASLRKNYPLLDGFFYPIANTESAIFIVKGWYNYFKYRIIFWETKHQIDSKKRPLKINEFGVSIRAYYEISEKLWNKYLQEEKHLQNEDVIEAMVAISNIYAKFVSSNNPKREDLQKIDNDIKNRTIKYFEYIQIAYLNNALKYFRLASEVSSVRLQTHDEIIANYIQVSILISLMNLEVTQNKSMYSDWLSDLLSQIGGVNSNVQGNMFEGLKFHILVAGAYGEYSFESAFAHYEVARSICDTLDNHLPIILKGRIVGRQLDLLGNMTTFVRPDQILHLANQALQIYNSYSGDGINSDDLENFKGSARWWITEACARLAQADEKNLDSYLNTANQHFNWIKRQARDNPELKKDYLPKIKQVQAEFAALQGDYKSAILHCQSALSDFDNNLFEQIQTLGSLISYYSTFFEREESNADEKYKIGFSGNLQNLRIKLLQARELYTSSKHRDILYRKTSEVSIRYGKIAWRTSMREQEQLLQEAIDLWFFGISGLLDWRLAGRAAIELSIVKEISEQHHLFSLPLEFDNLIKRCVSEWDPRRELTDKISVEKALSYLIGSNKELAKPIPETSNKLAVIEQCRLMFARDKRDTQNIYSVLKDALKLIEIDNPTSEDIDLIKLLLVCCSEEKDFEKVKEYNELLKKVSNSLASKVYLDVANAFMDAPEIHERYLRMAAAIGSSRFSAEANRQISEMLNKSGVRKPDLAKDDLEKINFARLMGIEKFDVSESYNLLFLFENEFRRLIAYQFNKRDGWWKKGIPSDLYDRVIKENKEHVKGVELLRRLNLGDLFKIIKFGDNWEQIFKLIFLAISYIESREAIILPFRNKIAHTNPDISRPEVDEFAAVTKNMIMHMQSYLPQ